MRKASFVILVVFILVFTALSPAQKPTTTVSSAPAIAERPQVPRLIRFSGTILGADSTPRTDTAGITFSLFQNQAGGAPLWQEVQNVTLDAAGHYSVLLGATSKDGIPAELFASNEARWLGVQVEQDPEQPRVLLVSVPYALKAGDAETVGGHPLSDFVLSPSAADASTGSGANGGSPKPKSLATTSTSAPAPLVATAVNAVAKFSDTIGTVANSQITDDGTNVKLNTTGSKLFFSTPAGNPPYFSGNSDNQLDVLGASGGTRWLNNAGTIVNMVLLDNGNIGVGTGAPAAKLDVVGNANVYGNLKFAASNGQLQFNTPTGNAPYFSGNLDSQLDVRGAIGGTRWLNNAGSLVNMSLLDNGNVGIGIGGPAAKLDVNGNLIVRSGGVTFPDGTVQSTKATITGITPGSGLTGGGANGNVTLSADFSSVQKRVTGTCSSGTAMAFVGSDGSVSCNTVSGGGGSLTLPFSGTGAATAPNGLLNITNTSNGPAPSNGSPDTNTIPAAILGVASGTGVTIGVVGKATGPDGVGVLGITSTSENPPVAALNLATGIAGGTQALYAELDNAGGDVIQAYSPATSGVITAFRGELNSPGAKGLALDFHVSPSFVIGAFVGPSGNQSQVFLVAGDGTINTNAGINAKGTIYSNTGFSAPVKFFKIDHPLDPAHKWLYHTSVESPDMMNLYSGTVRLDKHGEAWVTLPDWFEALSRDFRYQLTSIGRFMPVYIAREISGNRFKIAGGKPGARVSWLVTGVRQDAFANDNRTQVEQEKEGADIGSYYQPKSVTAANSTDRRIMATPVR